jgi:hypothetical protein
MRKVSTRPLGASDFFFLFFCHVSSETKDWKKYLGINTRLKKGFALRNCFFFVSRFVQRMATQSLELVDLNRELNCVHHSRPWKLHRLTVIQRLFLISNLTSWQKISSISFCSHNRLSNLPETIYNRIDHNQWKMCIVLFTLNC